MTKNKSLSLPLSLLSLSAFALLGGCDPIGLNFPVPTDPNAGLPVSLQPGSKNISAPRTTCGEDCEIVDISPGTTATCALTQDGRALCAGGDIQTGEELTGLRELDLEDGEAATLVPGAGLYHCFAGGPRTVCWDGNARAGQNVSMELIGGGLGAALTLHERCIVMSDGDLHCRVDINNDGQFEMIGRAESVVEFELAEDFGCALEEAGSPTCWGNDNAGQLNVPEIDGVSDLSVGSSGACVIDGEELLCWGFIGEGREDLLEGGEVDCDSAECGERRYPAPGVVQVAVGKESLCYLNDDGAVFCMGGNRAGQLGDGSYEASETFVRVAGLPEAKQLRAGRLTNCVVTTDGAGYCWGDGEFGMLNAEGLDTCTSTRDSMDGFPCSASPVRTF